MAFIDSGPVDATDRFETTPKERWPHLMRAKRSFLAVNINYDCRCLIEFVKEAEEVWQDLAFDSSEDMIRNGYELDPVEIELAVAWLRHNEPEEAIGLNDVSKQIAVAEAKKEKQQGKRTDRLDGNTIKLDRGSTAENILRRLLREERTEFVEAIKSGEMSVNQAAIAAGYRKKLSEAEKCVRAFRKAENQAELLRTLHAILEGCGGSGGE